MQFLEGGGGNLPQMPHPGSAIAQVTVERVKLQTNYPVERSATNKTLRRVFSYNKSTFRAISNEQINTNLPVERYASNKSPCREFSYKKSPCRDIN